MNGQRSIETKEWYDRYYAAKGADRNDIRNPEVLFQELALQIAFIRSFAAIDRHAWRTLQRFGLVEPQPAGTGLRRQDFAAFTAICRSVGEPVVSSR